MAIDFNTPPYYDDFEKTSRFYKILFKPGRAVQARELTQIQSILQNQIEQLGTNIFKEGSIVVGGKSFLSPGSYIKIQETADSSTFEGKEVTGATSGAKAIVRKVSPVKSIDGTVYDAALHVVYKTGVAFQQNETITIDGTTTSVTSLNSSSFTGQTLFYSIDESVFFVKGYFVYCAPQTVVVSPTFKFQPSARIGLIATEGTVSADEDSTLLDPAVGTNNYFAPGADRYFIDLTLTTLEYDVTVEGSDDVTIEDYVEICNIRRGEIASINSVTSYNELEKALARRTYDESGDYTVKPFIAKVQDHYYGNTSLLSVQVSPGKAYVRGFEFETVAPSYITMERARDYESENGYSVALDYSRYTAVDNVVGFINFTEAQQVTLHTVRGNLVDATNANTYATTTIGTARARYLQHESGNTYNLYLFDINLNTGNTFSKANSFVVANTTAGSIITRCDVASQGNAALTYGTDDTFLFTVPQKNIKTYLDGTGASDTTYAASRNFSSTTFSPGTGIYAAGTGNSVATLTVSGQDSFTGSGIIGDSAILERYYAVVTASPSGTPAVGTVLDFTGSNGEIEVSGVNSYLRYKGSNTSFTANVIAEVSSAQAQSKTKTLALGNVTATYGVYGNTISSLSLGYSDVYEIVSITDAQGNAWLGSYVLDNGQRDDYYDHASISLATGASGPTLDSVNNPNVTVQFRYFGHTGTGYFDADSYTKGGMDWGNIPTYKKSNGNYVRLSDVIDFRPVRVNGGTSFVSGRVPAPNSSLVADYDYYLPRRDKLVLTKERKIAVVKGLPSLAPNLPADLPDSMTLYTLEVPAYTGKATDVQAVYVDNKRYTMRDIGKIEKRVNRLEYYTALSFLEKIAADQRIEGLIPGIDRFKNGILVDPFAGHSVADVNNGDLKCSIDFENNLLRPRFVSESYLYSVNGIDSSDYAKSFDVVTMAYTEESFINQTKATNSVYLTPFEVFTWTGTMTLTPSTDVWADTITNPTVTVNLNGENDAFTQITLDKTGLSPWGTRWNDWQSVFRGVTDVKVDTASVTKVSNEVKVSKDGKISVTPTATTETTTSTSVTTQESFARTGLEFSSAQKTITAQLGEKVIDSSIIPFIRSRPITFVARNLKPLTTLFATFDGIDVTQYCQPSAEVILSTPAADLPNNIVELNVLSGSNVISKGHVIHQRANVLYMMPNVRFQLSEVGNTATLTYAVNGANTSTTANIVSLTTYTELVTNDVGDIAGVFRIPNDTNLSFNLGERAFKVADSLDKRFITTVAETKYLAYGLSQTKEDTLLATRMNLVSIDPMLEVKKGDAVTSTTKSVNKGVATVGTSNEAQLPPPVAAVENVQTLFCGETVNASGNNGVLHFKLNLGSGVGPANIICNSGTIPDRFTLIYNGEEQSTGFMSAGGSGVGPTYNERLKELGYPEITRYGANNVKLEFLKQDTGVEFATVRVDAPMKGTGWNFQVQCPSGTANPAPGTAKLTSSDTALTLSDRDFGRNGWADTNTTQTGTTDLCVKFQVTNTASNPRWSKLGIDKSINVRAVNIDTSRLTTNQGTFTVEAIGPSQGLYNSTLYPGKTSASYENTLGAVDPNVIEAGGSRIFSVRVQKSVNAVIRGTLRVYLTITGPGAAGTQSVSCNYVDININTTTPPMRVNVDPLAQQFFVLERDFPNGIFLSSLDLWFFEKDDLVPVSVELRPSVNGYPSTTQLIPFAYKVLDSTEVTASTTFNSSNYTRFAFPAPIYLAPGEYHVVIRGNSKKYRLFSAVLGEYQLDNPAVRVTEQPYIGSMFKSQNAATWQAEGTEDITFRLNKCVFDTTTPAAVILDARAPSNNVEYDVFFTTGETVEFADTAIAYAFKPTSEATGLAAPSFQRYMIGSNYTLDERKVVKSSDGETLKFQVTLSTNDPDITPVFDTERLSSVLIRNIINNDSTGEDSVSGGNALAKYITRRVTLAPGFEAQDMKVYLNAFCPGPSTVKVYYKVNAPGTTDFDTQNSYVEMTQSSKSGDERSGFAEFTFSTPSGYCLTDQSLYNIFTVKIVMLSSDTTQVPIVRDLRVLAIDAY